MKPKKPANKNRQREPFRVELIQTIDPGHGLVKLANAVDWDQLDEVFGKTYCPDKGRPAISTRLMVSLHYLKSTHNLSAIIPEGDVYRLIDQTLGHAQS